METVLLVIHLLIVVALIGVVLLQRSEGGALGMGGGGAGNFMTARGAANILSRSTAILATAFFFTSIALVMVSRPSGSGTSIIDGVQAPAGEVQPTPAPPSGDAGSLIDRLGGTGNQAPVAPSAPAAPTPPQSP